MTFLKLIPPLLAALLVAAHFLRAGEIGLVAVALVAPFLLLIRRRWVVHGARLMLLAAALVWVTVTYELVQLRIALGEPWLRMALILGGVALFTGAATLSLSARRVRQRYAKGAGTAASSAAAFLLTGLTLTVVQLKVASPMLLLERFWPGGGWLEILALSVYAAWIAEKMDRPKDSGKWRRKIWVAFSIVFFVQLLLGLAGMDGFLMTGRLHPPVPALIAAGPIFRGTRFFMPILFGATLLLVGPAWCSHLCYIGAWDQAASKRRRRPLPLPGWSRPARAALLFLVVAAALGLRLFGVSPQVAGAMGLGFGVVGVAVMLVWSRRSGVMTHCAVYCPIGLLADLGGKLSLFRIRINDGCDDCGKCTKACRYDALNRRDIENRKPGLTCTLCGDCLPRCKNDQIEYRFGKWRGPRVRAAFIVLVISLHAVFMGVARI